MEMLPKGSFFLCLNYVDLIRNRIASENMQSKDRAKYGKEFTKINLYSFYSFYKKFPNIFHSVSEKSNQLLSWMHYRS